MSQPTNEPLRVAVIGFGKLGLLHSGIVNGLGASRLAAVADTSSVSLKFLKSKMPKVNIYSDYKKMLETETLDAAFIATPTGLHVPIAIDCVNAGVSIFLEKPLSLNAEEARPLIAALKERPVTNMVGYMGRYTDTFMKAKQIIDSGCLGRPQMFRSSMYIGQLFKKGKGWRYDPKVSGGGCLITQNAHLIDKLLWFFGELDFVSAQTNSFYSESVEDNAHAYFKFKNGLGGYLDSSWSARNVRKMTMSIFYQGDNGTLEVNDDCVRLYLVEQNKDYNKNWTVWQKPDLYEGVSFDIGGPHYTLQAEEFFSGIRNQTPIKSTIETALQTQKAIDAVYHSARQSGAPVKLSEVH